MSDNTENNVSIYFKSLTLENVKCFKGEHKINFTDKNGNWAKWTVILGNNNMGKTTILKGLKIRITEEGAGKSRMWYIYPDIIPIWKPPKEVDSWFSRKVAIKKLQIKTEILKSQQNITELWNTGFEAKNESNLPLSIFQEYVENTHIDIQSLNPLYYGISRKFSKINLQKNDKEIDPFSDDFRVINPEEWILKIFLAKQNNIAKAKARFEGIKGIITSGLLPNVTDFEIETDPESLESYVLFHTDFGKVRLEEMGYGYQVSLAWIMDLAKRMFERYPDAENPLQMPAIVLVDELDLHLHPEWQRKIISFLSTHFPQTQFIATAHSPLLVQSAEEVNLVILHKNGDSVEISQPDIQNFSGWTVEEILTDIMGLENRVYSERYLQLIRQFDEALDTDNYKEAKSAYDELDKILHPKSSQRKLMRIQMTSLVPDTTSENAI